ncbi:MAG: hypothetical protein OXH36_01110 [Bdellovibrionales bacterium]|nr:hypothetical protein [Bdellovibrionales bacterium]
MTKEQIKEKVKRAQKELLDVVLEYYKNIKPKEYFGARRLSNEVGFIQAYNCGFAHALLIELKKDGLLEQSNGKGFKYNPYSCKKREKHVLAKVGRSNRMGVK